MAAQWSMDQVPAEWLCTITVRRGGRTVRGEAVPEQTFQIPRALIGWDNSTEQAWNQDPEDTATLVLEVGQAALGQDEPFEFERKDIVDVPKGPWPYGRWKLIGNAKYGQLGTQVQLRRDI